MRLADSGAPILSWVVLPRSAFASVLKPASEIKLCIQKIDASDFYQIGKFPIPLANNTSFLIQKRQHVPKEQLVILMPQACSCCVYRTMLPPPNPPAPQPDCVQGEPSWPTSPVCCGEWIVTNSVSHPPAEVQLQTDVDLSVSL